MGTKLFGNINVALVLGLAQFAHHLPHRLAGTPGTPPRKLDPKAEAIKSRMEAGA